MDFSECSQAPNIRPMKTYTLLFLAMTCSFTQAFAAIPVKELRVFKGERRLEIIGNNNQVLKTYKVMLGRNPEGKKMQEGDFKTPEGEYILDAKHPDSDFHKAFHISYPNLKDKLKARMLGVSPGGDIMLHGYPNNFFDMTSWLKSVGFENAAEEVIRAGLSNFDWTSGCIAVTDEEIDEIFAMVDVPTKIIIKP